MRRVDFALLAGISAVYLLVAAKVLAFPVNGDEPRYLLMAHSIVYDRDLDLANNMANGDYRGFIPALDYQAMRPFGHPGEAYALHYVGLPFLLAPGYAIAGRIGATMVLLAAGILTATGVLAMARRVDPAGLAAPTATALVALSLPLLFYPAQVFPEIVGAALIAWGVLATTSCGRWRRPIATSAALGLALAYLPWLHAKFLVAIALLYGLAFLKWRRGELGRREMALLVAPLAPSYALMAIGYLRWYGHALPTGPMAVAGLSSLARQTNGWVGFLVDREYGLFVRSPAFLAAAVALPFAVWRGAVLARIALVLFVAFILVGSTNFDWWGGASIPPRYLVPVLPAMVVPLTWTLSRVGWARAPIAVLGAASLLFAYSAVRYPDLSFASADSRGESVMLSHYGRQLGVDLNGLLPTFVRGPLVDERTGWEWVPGRDQAGYALRDIQWEFRGRIRVAIDARGAGESARYEVWRGGAVIASSAAPVFEFVSSTAREAHELRVAWDGRAPLAISRVLVTSE